MRHRLRGLLGGTVSGQFARFFLIGIVGFIIDAGGFNLLAYADLSPLQGHPKTSKAVSGLVATAAAWVGNRYWTFRDQRTDSKLREFVQFLVIGMLGNLIAWACLWISHDGLGLTSKVADNISGNGIGLTLAVLFRFWMYRTHVFGAEGDGTPLSDIEHLLEDESPPQP